MSGSSDVETTLMSIRQQLAKMLQEVNSRAHASTITMCGRQVSRAEAVSITVDMMKGLARLAEMIGCPPDLENLNHEVKRIDAAPRYGGAISEVWQGSWLGYQLVRTPYVPPFRSI